MGCWVSAIAAHSADLRRGQLHADGCASKTVLLAQLSFGVVAEHVICHLPSDCRTHASVTVRASHARLCCRRSHSLSLICLLITCFSKSNLSSVQRVQHVLHEGYSIDSTHTEPYANRLSHGLRTFDEFVTTALQHNLLTGKGGFAVSFYVLLKNATAAKAKVPTYRRICKLLCKQSLLVMRRHAVCHLCA